MQGSTNNYPLIMGIINLTPDSFYSHNMQCDSNLYDNLDFKYADIIDVGCESSRPGAKPVSEKNELLRLSQFIDKGYNFPCITSIDTYKPVVARFALENGFNMINDIKAGGDNDSKLG